MSEPRSPLATVTVRSWSRQFPRHQEHGGSAYSFIEINSGAETFEDFKLRMANQSAEQLLDDALAEIWQCGVLHRYRYMKLRVALRWLLAALALLLVTVAVSAFFP